MRQNVRAAAMAYLQRNDFKTCMGTGTFFTAHALKRATACFLMSSLQKERLLQDGNNLKKGWRAPIRSVLLAPRRGS